MAKKSPLRQLAQDYYDGSIDRAYYLGQRHSLIDSIVAEGNGAPHLESATIPGAFISQSAEQLDSTDLSNALAQRQTVPATEAGGIDFPGQDNLRNTIPTGESYADASFGDRADTRTGLQNKDNGRGGIVPAGQSSNTSRASDKPSRQWLRGALWIVGGLLVIALAVILR